MTTFEFHVTYARSFVDCPKAHLSTCKRRAKYPSKIFWAEGDDPLTALEAHETAAFKNDYRYRLCVGAMCCIDPTGKER